MEEELRFVYEYERDEETMVELCSRYGVSRETGYVWLRRYREHGVRGLEELDRNWPGRRWPATSTIGEPSPCFLQKSQ